MTGMGVREMRHSEPFHTTLYSQCSFLHYLARRLGREVELGCKRAPLRLIQKYALTAEEQYLALRFFYACLFRRLGRHDEVKRIGAHNYRPLTSAEKSKIISMRLAGASLSEIASALNRYPSTIYYYIKRVEEKKGQE